MKAGFYEVEITPPIGSGIPGYMSPRWCRGVKQKLYAKAAVLESKGVYSAFLVIDVLDLPVGLPDIVRERVSQNSEIEKNAIMMAATHAHTALPVRKDEFKDSDTERDAKIIEMTSLLAADAVIMAYQRMVPVKGYFGMGSAEGVSFVRQYHIKDGTIRTNPGYCIEDVVKPYSEPDCRLPLFIFRDEAGNNIGSIACFALHHDTVGGEEYSSDYSGLVAKHLKKAYGDNFVSVFFQGFCGNINHLDFTNTEPDVSTEHIAEVITEAFLKTADDAILLKDDTIAVKMDTVSVNKRRDAAEFVDKCKYLLDNPPGPGNMTIADPYSDRMMYACARIVLEWHDIDKRKVLEAPVQVIRIGSCMIYALPGEVFSQFGDKIRALSPVENVMTVSMAHTDEVRAYVPIPELFLPYVYESSVYSALFEADGGDKMVRKAIEIAKELV